MKTNRSYHIPGEAVVFRTLSKDLEDVDNEENIHIYDHGTLSGDKLLHHSNSDKLVEEFRKLISIEIKSQSLFSLKINQALGSLKKNRTK